MTVRTPCRQWRVRLCGCLVALFAPGPLALAQGLADPSTNFWREPILSGDLALLDRFSPPAAEKSSVGRVPRIQIFRIPPGFLSDPVGLDSDDTLTDPEAALLPSAEPAGSGAVQASFGVDNPFFDFRAPGDPGGVGFYKLHAQCQLIESERAGLCLGLRAATPAGLDSDGVAQGPTVFSPALSWFRELGGGTALQSFVGDNFHANSRWRDSTGHSLRSGVAVQSQIPGINPGPGQSVHMVVSALGRDRLDSDADRHPLGTWQLVPGVHWQAGDSCWLACGVIVPVGPARSESGLWQITCSWRY
jgi:hypothetical protein